MMDPFYSGWFQEPDYADNGGVPNSSGNPNLWTTITQGINSIPAIVASTQGKNVSTQPGGAYSVRTNYQTSGWVIGLLALVLVGMVGYLAAGHAK